MNLTCQSELNDCLLDQEAEVWVVLVTSLALWGSPWQKVSVHACAWVYTLPCVSVSVRLTHVSTPYPMPTQDERRRPPAPLGRVKVCHLLFPL